jgi:hypothetical protein
MSVRIEFVNYNDTIEYTPERPKEPVVLRFDTTFAQLTYDLLRVGPDGDDVAFYDQERGQWRLAGDWPNDGQWHEIREHLSEAGYSDVSISFE